MRACIDRKPSDPSVSLSPLGDLKQEILARTESVKELKTSKTERDHNNNNNNNNNNSSSSTENKIDKELLTELLMDLGLAGSALNENITKLSEISVADMVTWIEKREQQNYIFSGLSHFTNSSIDQIPSQTTAVSGKSGSGVSSSNLNWVEGSVKSCKTISAKGSAKGSAKSNSLRGGNSGKNIRKGKEEGNGIGIGNGIIRNDDVENELRRGENVNNSNNNNNNNSNNNITRTRSRSIPSDSANVNGNNSNSNSNSNSNGNSNSNNNNNSNSNGNNNNNSNYNNNNNNNSNVNGGSSITEYGLGGQMNWGCGVLLGPGLSFTSTSNQIQNNVSNHGNGNRNGNGNINSNRVVEPSESSESGYSSSSPVVSDSEEEEGEEEGEEEDGRGYEYDEDNTDSIHQGNSGRFLRSSYMEEGNEDEEEEEEEEEGEVEDEVSSIGRSTSSLNSFNRHHHSVKSECELAKIDEEDEFDDDDSNYDNNSNSNSNNNHNTTKNRIKKNFNQHIDLQSISYCQPKHQIGNENEPVTDNENDNRNGNGDENENDWINWIDALSDQSRQRVWLQRGLHLICEICRGNFRAQKKSAHFLPPELLLFLIQSEMLSQENRYDLFFCPLFFP